MIVYLTLSERLSLVDLVSTFESKRDILRDCCELLSELAITKSEATNPDLNLRYNSNIGSFEYNVEFDKIKECTLSKKIYDVINESTGFFEKIKSRA